MLPGNQRVQGGREAAEAGKLTGAWESLDSSSRLIQMHGSPSCAHGSTS